MSQSKNELCKVAASSLKLKDIKLYGSRFEHGEYIGPEGVQEEKKGTHYNKSTIEFEGGEHELLEILVLFGIRIVPPDTNEEAENPPFSFLIEAEYVVEYEIIDELSEEAIKAFAEFNAVHNAWPFWRQHVYDIVQRARLPKLDVPLFTG
jgi:hypothetical protein